MLQDTLYINFRLGITFKKYKKANKNATYLPIILSVVKIQHVQKIMIL